MSGKPAARQGDMTQYGGPIVQGSAGVRIGAPTGVTDGAGREFRLVLTTQAQRAEEARKQHTASLFSPDTPRPLSASAFPDTLPGTEYGPDRGIR
ncbi:hypothetical protein, partial [Escherichia coli]